MSSASINAIDNRSAEVALSVLPLFCAMSLYSYGSAASMYQRVSRVGRDQHRVRGRVQVHVLQIVDRHGDDLFHVLVHSPAVGVTDTAVLDVQQLHQHLLAHFIWIGHICLQVLPARVLQHLRELQRNQPVRWVVVLRLLPHKRYILWGAFALPEKHDTLVQQRPRRSPRIIVSLPLRLQLLRQLDGPCLLRLLHGVNRQEADRRNKAEQKHRLRRVRVHLHPHEARQARHAARSVAEHGLRKAALATEGGTGAVLPKRLQ
ncbi:hypothetical protein, conserved [Leishmania tarentolae]|uniref:Uncharacterized protein n=1 Tax=Leishmania tarentolae TaxID=5689 RepID=A0A640K947_LEITA|nr:hypothetical protein, conserved [Leishmania tarentolae]